MTRQHPELDLEQAYVDHAYECLERSRSSAWRLRGLTEADLGGTFQARFERNAFDEALIKRLADLDLGDASLVFGRIDRRIADDGSETDSREGTEIGAEGGGEIGGEDRAGARTESFHIGRLAVADDDSEPVVIDWRAPIAEPFYRATGRQPMGLTRRRHFVVEGRRVLGLEDELFGEGHLGIGHDEGLDRPAEGLRGYSSLMAALERGRTGSLGDIVATIQAEQDEIIRAPQAGVLVVDGGPGTGKTVVALHRAAYLLYTHRFPLEDQGVLVIGPNRVFMRYIERVLPSLGEAGIDQVVLADLVPGVRFEGSDPIPVARIKGDIRMDRVLGRAIRQRQRPLRSELVVPFRSGYVRLSVDESRRIVEAARRRFRRHNAARRFVETEVLTALADSWRTDDVEVQEMRDAVRYLPETRQALERMWPVLTPAELLHDLLGARALLGLALKNDFAEGAVDLLYRPRSPHVDDVHWSLDDAALLDAARARLGPRHDSQGRARESDEIRTYGHIVIDEVQDLTPMQLAMATRRSLNGSMTVVGDIAQATGPLAPDGWDDVLAHLPDRRPPRRVGLTVGYRIPAQIMDIAVGVMRVATPDATAPTAVRIGESGPRLVEVGDLLGGVVDEVRRVLGEVDSGSVGVVVPDRRASAVSEALSAAGLEHGRAGSGLDQPLTVVATSVVKGLELDAVIVVEPADIVESESQGLRLLYVALTRATQRLSVVHVRPLPAAMTTRPDQVP